MSRAASELLPPAGFLAACLALQLSFDRIIGSDGFFHIRQAEAPLGGMPWLPHSIFADGWVDHQLLFHAALWPFTAIPDGVLAAKIGAAVLAAVAFEALRRLLRSMEVPSPALFAVLPAAVCWRFWLRMEMPRTQSLSVALLAAGLWALVHQRRRALFAIAWIYAWTYQVSLVLLPVGVLFVLVSLAWGRDPAREAGRSLAAAAGGLACGFVVHPHSPGTLRFLYQHVVLKVLNRHELPVGTEWTVSGLLPLFTQVGGGVLVLLAALAMLVRTTQRTRDAAFFGALAICATLGTMQAVKFLEYSVPLACVALAVALRDARVVVPRWVWAPVGIALVASAVTVRGAVLASEPAPRRLEAAAAALGAHAAPGDIVHHFSWSDFPELVFHAPEQRYIVGLDPHFLALHDPELWDLYRKIERGWGRNPSKPIRERFGASWAVLVLPHEGAEAVLARDPGLEVVHRDEHAVVYRVLGP